MGRLFGTDGIRGLANVDLGPELAMSVASAAARVLAEHARGGRPAVVLGRDPRASGEMLEAAVTAGLTSAGADVLRVGVVPTPAVAHLTGALGADFGVMISASHNPMPDNGIKLFAAGGHKLPDRVEDEIEGRLATTSAGPTGPTASTGTTASPRPTGAAIGRVRDVPDAVERYADHLLAAAPEPLRGLHVVVDCAHGAASAAAPAAYERAGARVTAVHAAPDGWNINDGVGSTHVDGLGTLVRDAGADLGIAHDGDADRCLAVTADGSVVDGDQILAVLALAMRDAGTLAADTLVATVMSNLGLHLAMEAAGVAVRTTKVGDRYVLEELRAGGYSLGGEQSGHVVLPAHATTGDGLLTALSLMSRMASTGSSLAELVKVMTRLPQALVNVPVTDKDVVRSAAVVDAVAAAEAELAGHGRVLLRPSGTEPLVRVMVEAPSEDVAGEIADRLAALVSAPR